MRSITGILAPPNDCDWLTASKLKIYATQRVNKRESGDVRDSRYSVDLKFKHLKLKVLSDRRPRRPILLMVVIGKLLRNPTKPPPEKSHDDDCQPCNEG